MAFILNLTQIAGTSCAAPIFAGVISLVNDALLKAGKKPVGFLNPVPTRPALFHLRTLVLILILYSHGSLELSPTSLPLIPLLH